MVLVVEIIPHESQGPIYPMYSRYIKGLMVVNIIAANVLATQRARVWATMVCSQFSFLEYSVPLEFIIVS